MAETTHSARHVVTVQAYHERTKHHLTAYTAGPDTLDWDAQPDPFRRYTDTPQTPLPLQADHLTTPWADLFEPGRIAPHSLDRDAIGLLFELGFALSAWKQYGPDRWAMRVNPSSGNLQLAALLGLGREADFGKAEREEPAALFELPPTPAVPDSPFNWPAPSPWQGVANRLDPHPMYRWPVMDEVAVATQTKTTNLIAASAYPIRARWLKHPIKSIQMSDPLDALARSTQPAATLIRQRRSAQHFDARARMPLAQLWRLLPRRVAAGDLLRRSLPAELHLNAVPHAQFDAPLPDACIATEPPYAHLLSERRS